MSAALRAAWAKARIAYLRRRHFGERAPIKQAVAWFGGCLLIFQIPALRVALFDNPGSADWIDKGAYGAAALCFACALVAILSGSEKSAKDREAAAAAEKTIERLSRQAHRDEIDAATEPAKDSAPARRPRL